MPNPPPLFPTVTYPFVIFHNPTVLCGFIEAAGRAIPAQFDIELAYPLDIFFIPSISSLYFCGGIDDEYPITFPRPTAPRAYDIETLSPVSMILELIPLCK